MLLSFSKMNVLLRQNQVIHRYENLHSSTKFMYISIIYLLHFCILSFGVSLLRFKYPTTHKNCKWNVMVWTTFFTLIFLQKGKTKDVYCYLNFLVCFVFSLSSFFNVFLLSVLIFSLMFSAPLPLTKKTLILIKYHLIWH